MTDEGKLRYALKHPYSDGTTHFLFEPLDPLAELAALVPRPPVNLTRDHGVFAPNSKLRPRLVPGKPHKKRGHKPDASIQPTPSQPVLSEPTPMTWAQRRKRACEFDVTVCPLCGGTLRVIADITDPVEQPHSTPYTHDPTGLNSNEICSTRIRSSLPQNTSNLSYPFGPQTHPSIACVHSSCRHISPLLYEPVYEVHYARKNRFAANTC